MTACLCRNYTASWLRRTFGSIKKISVLRPYRCITTNGCNQSVISSIAIEIEAFAVRTGVNVDQLLIVSLVYIVTSSGTSQHHLKHQTTHICATSSARQRQVHSRRKASKTALNEVDPFGEDVEIGIDVLFGTGYWRRLII
jgi:hypothetical protein